LVLLVPQEIQVVLQVLQVLKVTRGCPAMLVPVVQKVLLVQRVPLAREAILDLKEQQAPLVFQDLRVAQVVPLVQPEPRDQKVTRVTLGLQEPQELQAVLREPQELQDQVS
jgi:ABC-type amino acid transport substrate-binding protein